MKAWLADEAATVAFAERFLELMPADLAGWIVLLNGELGAGKSTFARALITAAGQTGPVPSPTYTLVEPYALPRGNFYHIDLYRVADEEELRYLGWTELEDGCRLVEWPDRAPRLMAEADVDLTLFYEGSGRRAELNGRSERGKALVRQMASADSKD